MQSYTWNFDLPDNAECLGCRYPLANLVEPVCPECGREFNPPDRSTYGPKLSGPTMAWASRGPGLPTLAACGVAVAVWLLASSTPGRDLLWFLIGLPLSFVLAGGFAIRLLISPFAAGSLAAWLAAVRRDWWRWLAVPLAGLLSIVIVQTQAGWVMRWAISRPPMDRLAADVRAGRPIGHGSWHGVIRVDNALLSGTEVHAELPRGHMLSDFAVLIHSPAGPPAPMYGAVIHPLGNGWYASVIY